MKRLLAFPFLLLGSATATFAADAHSLIVYIDKTSEQEDIAPVWITAASTLNILYKTTPKSLNRTQKSRSEIKSIYFYEPPIFKEAMELYESRDYVGAKSKFAACKEAFKPVDDLPGNYSTLAGFYELECCRKTFDLEQLDKLLSAYQSASLVRKHHRNQLQLYPLWDAVRTKDWARLDSLATKAQEERKWVPEHLAQIKYCHGLALEGLDRPIDALNQFNGAFTADYTASEQITTRAAASCLRILKKHEEVQLAMKLWGTDDEDPNSNGYALLQEAVALCELWKQALGGRKPLPSEFSSFLKYKENNAPKPKPKAAEKNGPEKDVEKKSA